MAVSSTEVYNASFDSTSLMFNNVTPSIFSTEYNSTSGGDNGDDYSGTVLTLASRNWTDSMQSSTSYPGENDNIGQDDEEPSPEQLLHFWIGVGLSISSSLFIGLSFIIKKKALIKLSTAGKRANQGGYGYLKDLLWWSGLLSMGIGEAANFMAYTFAPASLVSTLGVLSVLVTAILSSKYLNERLNFLGKIGCFLCTIGSTVIVIHAPMEKDIESMYDLQIRLTNVVFVSYVLLTIIFSVILIYHYLPKLPETSTYTLLIWIGVCSMIGSLSVMSVKGLGLAMMHTITGTQNELGNWLTWFCFLALIVCVSVQMNFLNKALDTFNTAVVTPIYYVFFTTCVILASAILFNEFAYLPVNDWVGLFCGFNTVLTAIVILHLCKNFDVTLLNLAQQIDFVNHSQNSRSHDHHHQQQLSDKIRELDLKKVISSDRLHHNREEDDDEDDDTMFKSADSFTSSTKSQKKGSLTPDVKLLSGSFSDGRRNRDGYVPLSYGTTDSFDRHSSNV